MTWQVGALRFGYEKQLFETITHQEYIGTCLSKYPRNGNLTKRYLLGNAMKVTVSLFPDLYYLYQECLGRVGENIQGDLYIQQQSDYNAGVYAVGNRFDLVLASAIARDFPPVEIAFVMGHELGHVLFEHHQIPVQYILRDPQGISYKIAKKILQWSRAAEISADRIGLLCSGSLSSAANVFFKISSGLSGQAEDKIINSLRDQYDEIAAISPSTFASEWFSTHPLIPIRFKSLELICLDILSLRHQPQKPRITWHKIDETITQVLKKTESLGGDQWELSPEKISVLILCLLYVAISDGEINSYEISFIEELHQVIAPDLNLEEIVALCQTNKREFQREATQAIASVSVTLTEAKQILRLTHDLAMVDPPLAMAEKKVMGEIAQLLTGDHNDYFRQILNKTSDFH